MSAPKRWARKLAGSGPADTYLDRYQITKTGNRKWDVIDLVTDRQQNRRPFPTMKAAREFTENYCGPVLP